MLGTRSLLWNEAIGRTTIFLSVLSAAIVALALLANATGFGPQTTTLALVLLPVVFFLGIATHSRVLEINQAEVELVLAMNRLRHAYLEIAPALEPYFTTGHHDDEQGLAASYGLHGGGLGRWRRFLATTPTVIGTVDAALAAAIVVLAAQAATALVERSRHCGLGDHGSHVKPTPRTEAGRKADMSAPSGQIPPPWAWWEIEHVMAGRDAAIAAALDELVQAASAHSEDPVDGGSGTRVPRTGQLGGKGDPR
jgi:hypothetical protein